MIDISWNLARTMLELTDCQNNVKAEVTTTTTQQTFIIPKSALYEIITKLQKLWGVPTEVTE